MARFARLFLFFPFVFLIVSCGASIPADLDSDFDGILDINDSLPHDTDNDKIPNEEDSDDDGDGVADADDAFPYDPTEAVDTDGDKIGNNADTDDDGDGILDVNDTFSLNFSESVDTDGDGTGDSSDPDADNDGFSDEDDLFPVDKTKAGDHDNDGVDSLTDRDDDNDGYLDSLEIEEGSSTLSASSTPPDADREGLTDAQEKVFGSNPAKTDSDDDGLSDKIEYDLQTDPNKSDTDDDDQTDLEEVGTDLNNIPDFDEDGLIDAKDFDRVFSFRELEAEPVESNERFGLGVKADGTIYVADSQVDQIKVFSEEGILQETIESPDVLGPFSFPNDVAVCDDGSIYIADTNNHRIEKFDSDYNYLDAYSDVVEGDLGSFLLPRGLACAGSVLYVADTQNERIQWRKSGDWSAFEVDQIPVDVAVMVSGKVATASRTSFQTSLFGKLGNLILTVNSTYLSESPFSFEPVGVAFDAEENLYILDAMQSRVLVFDPDGKFLRQFGSSDVFLFPTDIEIGEDGKIYVTDRYRVHIF